LTRSRNIHMKHYYVPLAELFRIIGATESSVFGRCFVVEALPRERTFRADGFEFASVEERDTLWESLHKTELKRRVAKETKKRYAAKQRDRDEESENLEATPDDEPAESEIISREDTTGSESYDEHLEEELLMEAAAEIDSDEDY
jgi:hypothetical protein